MKSTKYDYIDVDGTVLKPSPHRVRNILTLEERVRAIQAYECRPMYTKVAKMFNCSWEQIKNIIANREAIMEFYAATRQQRVDPQEQDLRQRKLNFLGECVFEYIQRVQFHTKADLTQELILMKAFEFRDIMDIESFTPNKAWLNRFKSTYNFSLSNRQITLTRTPPASLDLKDIMMYCSKNTAKADMSTLNQTTVKDLYRPTTTLAVASENDAAMEEIVQRRLRKINFLEKALFEYIQRSQYHHKVPLSEGLLRKVAHELRDALKIDNFVPNKTWYHNFRKKHNFDVAEFFLSSPRTPPLSLDLKDILSYCSRQEAKNQAKTQTLNTVTLTPKMPAHKFATPTSSRVVAATTISVVVHPPKPAQHQQEPKQQSTQTLSLQPLQEIKTEAIEIDNDEDIKPDLSELDTEQPPPKIRKIQPQNPMVEQTAHSPGHWSEHSNNEELPKQINNYDDALKLLKPLEEFAMLEENYRVIGLITQLEEIFKNAAKKIKE